VVGPEGTQVAAGAGHADLARGLPATPPMVCPWFSMTKIVTATAAMRLVDRGASPAWKRRISVSDLPRGGQSARHLEPSAAQL